MPCNYAKGRFLEKRWKSDKVRKKRFRKTTLKLYLRGSYRWQKEKPGQAGLKLQLQADR